MQCRGPDPLQPPYGPGYVAIVNINFYFQVCAGPATPRLQFRPPRLPPPRVSHYRWLRCCVPCARPLDSQDVANAFIDIMAPVYTASPQMRFILLVQLQAGRCGTNVTITGHTPPRGYIVIPDALSSGAQLVSGRDALLMRRAPWPAG